MELIFADSDSDESDCDEIQLSEEFEDITN